MGAAVAYHLSLSGWAAETVILEKGRWVKASNKLVELKAEHNFMIFIRVQNRQWHDVAFERFSGCI